MGFPKRYGVVRVWVFSKPRATFGKHPLVMESPLVFCKDSTHGLARDVTTEH